AWSGDVLPPPMRVQSGLPPKASTCSRTARMGRSPSARMAQPSASITQTLSRARAAVERSLYEARTAKLAICSAMVGFSSMRNVGVLSPGKFSPVGALFELLPRLLHHLRPARLLIADECAEFGGRHRAHLGTRLVE